MEKNRVYSKSAYSKMLISALSIFFIFLCLLPIIGPSFGSYILGANLHRYKKLYNFSETCAISSITIGEVFFLIVSASIIKIGLDFNNVSTFWFLILIIF